MNIEEEIKNHSTDSSIFKVVPREVIYPKNIEEISALIKKATEEGRCISIRAGGTCMSGGSLNDDIIINLTKNFKTIKINQYNKTAEVDMGVYYRDLEHEAMKYNLMFPSYTSSKDVCGIGGMLGNNASGEKSVRYGATIDNVLSVKVLLYDGNLYEFEEISDEECLRLSKENSFIGRIYKEIRSIYRDYGYEYAEAKGAVKKSASGYRIDRVFNKEKNTWNLSKIFIGSQSTLGILIQARIKLVEIPIHTRLIAIPINSLTLLPETLRLIMDNNPESVETFDINTFNMAKSFLPEDTLKVQGFFKEGIQLMILAQFDVDDIAHKILMDLKKINNNAEYVYDNEIKTSLWNIRRSSFRVMRDYNYDKPTKKAVPCIEDIIVPVEKFDSFIPEMMDILKTEKIQYGFHGHIGDGALRVIPVIDFEDKKVAMNKVIILMNKVFDLVKEMGGNMSADHSDGIIRTPFLKDFYGVELYENVIMAVKMLFDPKDVFNRGKKIGGPKKEDLVRMLGLGE